MAGIVPYRVQGQYSASFRPIATQLCEDFLHRLSQNTQTLWSHARQPQHSGDLHSLHPPSLGKHSHQERTPPSLTHLLPAEIWKCVRERGREREMTSSMLPLAWIMVVLHLWVSLILYIIPTWTSQELEEPSRLLLLIKCEYLERAWKWNPTSYLSQGQALGSHMVGWKYTVHPNTPTLKINCYKGHSS